MNFKINIKSKKIYYCLFVISLSFCFLFSFSNTCFASYPKLVSNIVSAFEKVESYIVAIATPAAAVSIGCRFSNAKI